MVIKDFEPLPRREVRQAFKRLRFLQAYDYQNRGWLTDIVGVMERLNLRPGQQFHLHDIYEYEEHLSELHPGNTRVRAKIRQVMQQLRDEGLIFFLGSGQYEVVSP